MKLIPNARTVVVRTEPDGVDVKLDGVPVGKTERPWDAAHEQPAAEIVVENVSLGDHTFELSKPCYRTVLLEDFVTVDINDYSPRVFKPVSLERVHAQFAIEGGPKGAEVRVDGIPFGDLPLEPLDLCPGKRVLEVRDGGRIIWRSVEKLPIDQGVTTLRLDPRPNIVLVATDAWPEDLAGMARALSTLGRIETGKQWWIGDWWNAGKWGQRPEILDQWDINYNTAKQCGVVAAAYQLTDRPSSPASMVLNLMLTW